MHTTRVIGYRDRRLCGSIGSVIIIIVIVVLRVLIVVPIIGIAIVLRVPIICRTPAVRVPVIGVPAVGIITIRIATVGIVLVIVVCRRIADWRCYRLLLGCLCLLCGSWIGVGMLTATDIVRSVDAGLSILRWTVHSTVVICLA